MTNCSTGTNVSNAPTIFCIKTEEPHYYITCYGSAEVICKLVLTINPRAVRIANFIGGYRIFPRIQDFISQTKCN